MLIGELSKRTGFSKDTIRYYEKMGLLKNVSTRLDNYYKDYSDEAVALLTNIHCGKKYGLTLNEMKELLTELSTTEDLFNLVRSKGYEKLAEVEREIENLVAIRQNLITGLRNLDSNVTIDMKKKC